MSTQKRWKTITRVGGPTGTSLPTPHRSKKAAYAWVGELRATFKTRPDAPSAVSVYLSEDGAAFQLYERLDFTKEV